MLSATIDKKARVQLSTDTLGTNFEWSKKTATGGFVPLATTDAGNYTDNRPNRNYRYKPAQDASCVYSGTFSNIYNSAHLSAAGNALSTSTLDDSITITTPPCTEVGLLFDRPAREAVDTDEVEVILDGVNLGTVLDTDNRSDYAVYSIMLWGKSDLPLQSHTITVTLLNAGVMTFDGYWYSDLKGDLGEQYTYQVIIDGGITETVTVTPTVDRKAVINDVLDRVDAEFAANRITPLVGLEWVDFAAGVAIAYWLTGRASLVSHMETLYQGFLANCDTNKLLYDPNQKGNSLVLNGRTPYAYWFAYKIFGDSRFLALADQVMSYFVNTWPKYTSSHNGTTYPGLWAIYSDGRTTLGTNYGDWYPNMWSSAVCSAALLYGEPASIHYHSPALLAAIQQNTAWAISNYDPATGELAYGTIDLRHSVLYGMVQWDWLKDVADNCGLYQTEVAHIGNWIASAAYQEEPLVILDTRYDWTSNTECLIYVALAKHINSVAVPQRMVDMAYSAACVKYYFKYKPDGGPDGTYNMDELLYRHIFWAARRAYRDNVPVSLWAADFGVIPPPSTGPAILNADGSAGGQILNIDGSDGSQIQDL